MTEGRTPRDHALGVVRHALDVHVDLMVALQYLGMLTPDAMTVMQDTHDDIIGRILSVPAAPEPQYARPERFRQTRPARTPIPTIHAPSPLVPGQRVSHGTRRVEGGRSLFAQWVDGEVDWSPEVMGWMADDARADGMIGVDGYDG